MTPPDLGALLALRDRVVACCVEGDRDLDEEITRAFGRVSHVGIPVCAGYGGIAAFTLDLNAAMRLVEYHLPPIKAFAPGSPTSSGWKINLYRGMTPTGEPHASWECCIRPHAGRDDWHSAPTAALAVLLALLSALIVQREHDGATSSRGTGTAGEGEESHG